MLAVKLDRSEDRVGGDALELFLLAVQVCGDTETCSVPLDFEVKGRLARYVASTVVSINYRQALSLKGTEGLSVQTQASTLTTCNLDAVLWHERL